MNKPIPLVSWNGTDDLTGLSRLKELEDSYGKNAVVVNTYQLAIQIPLEILGTRTSIIPVILPVTSGPDVIAAALRAGGHPLLLDIDESTLQLNPELLDSSLKELDGAIVVLNRPAGQAVSSDLLEVTKEYPTIVDSRLLPHSKLPFEDLIGTFNVFDLGPAMSSGGVIFHEYEKQLREMRLVRSGQLGHLGNFPEILCHIAKNRTSANNIVEREEGEKAVAQAYISSLKKHNKNDILMWTESSHWPMFYVKVLEADRAIAHLKSYDIHAKLAVFPLHYMTEVSLRYKVVPEYPIAEKLSKQVVALPTHKGVTDPEFIIEKLLEVTYD